MPPVTKYGNTPGRISSRHFCFHGTRNWTISSRRSVGMALAPAMTLKRMYHCAPRAMRKMPPMFRLTPRCRKRTTAKGKRRIAGKLGAHPNLHPDRHPDHAGHHHEHDAPDEGDQAKPEAAGELAEPGGALEVEDAAP